MSTGRGPSQPPLEALHADSTLIPSKLRIIDTLSTEELMESLEPGKKDSLKARPNGKMLDGHHRIKILRNRGVDVDSLPREIIPQDLIGDEPPSAQKGNP